MLFLQFSIFDGDESGLVYTDSTDFSTNNQSKPTFSHHKLTCFEYADGITIPSGYTISDLAMYYAKLSNAFNSTDRVIETTDRYPASDTGFSPQRPEFEIVGAFAADPITYLTSYLVMIHTCNHYSYHYQSTRIESIHHHIVAV